MPNENIKADFILLQPAAHSLGAGLSGWSWCGAWGRVGLTRDSRWHPVGTQLLSRQVVGG